MIARYLAAERDLGRLARDADLDILGLTLIGSGHLVFAGGEAAEPEAVHRRVASVLRSAVV
ncbi:hypothetical protein AB0J82_29285 [Asanoa sp. NPDC049518]|uniref:hypothetical protein n=1 Tax=unclassified Asanoa TaxID=2685164 RepID=UPI003425B5B1